MYTAHVFNLNYVNDKHARYPYNHSPCPGRVLIHAYRITKQRGEKIGEKCCTMPGHRRGYGGRIFHASYISRRWLGARFYISPGRDGAWERAKMRIECIVHTSAPTLRDRQLNPLYRRIIATENIGRVGLRMTAEPTKSTRRPTFRPIYCGENSSVLHAAMFR